jgi:hypothetical protein
MTRVSKGIAIQMTAAHNSRRIALTIRLMLQMTFCSRPVTPTIGGPTQFFDGHLVYRKQGRMAMRPYKAKDPALPV